MARWLKCMMNTAIIGMTGFVMAIVGCAILWGESSSVVGLSLLILGVVIGYAFGVFAIGCGLVYLRKRLTLEGSANLLKRDVMLSFRK